ncbi:MULTISPECIES: ester cyclase [Streptomyces]|uniref:ester cyclase n=1 Tax=Streptomyces TaxID=1883 RepID=UPI001907330D|nr:MULTISPECIES: ester cyclase [unclassified Streptomyces]MCU4745276.1 ester cyclase [Streptomyces sp. G-5]QQN79789.1 ester cyclase [Streptomyces sp. XC 2026]
MSDIDLREFYDRYCEALNAHEFDRMDEFVNESILSHGEPATRADVVAALKSITDAVPDMRWEIKEVAIHGETLACHCVNHGTPTKEWLGVAPTGAPIEIDEFALYRIRDGKFVQMSNVHDVEALKRQLAG